MFKVARPRQKKSPIDDEEFPFAESGDLEDDLAELFEPVSRPAPKSTRRKKRKSNPLQILAPFGNFISLEVVGRIVRVICILNMIITLPVMVIGTLGGRLIGIAIIFVFVGLSRLGMSGAAGNGVTFSRKSRIEGNAGIVTGIVLVGVSLLFNPWIAYPILQSLNFPRLTDPPASTRRAPPLVVPSASSDSAAQLSKAPAETTPPSPPGSARGGAFGPVAPVEGQRVLILKYAAFRGAGDAALAAQRALQGVGGIDPNVLLVDPAGGRIVIRTVGGVLRSIDVSAALQRAGFEMRPGIQMQAWSE